MSKYPITEEYIKKHPCNICKPKGDCCEFPDKLIEWNNKLWDIDTKALVAIVIGEYTTPKNIGRNHGI